MSGLAISMVVIPSCLRRYISTTVQDRRMR